MAALSDQQTNPWVHSLIFRLLEGRPEGTDWMMLYLVVFVYICMCLHFILFYFQFYVNFIFIYI